MGLREVKERVEQCLPSPFGEEVEIVNHEEHRATSSATIFQRSDNEFYVFLVQMSPACPWALG